MAAKDTQDSGKTVTVKVPAKGARAPATTAKKTFNAGPSRGDNSFPASNKRRVQDTSRTDRTSTAERQGAGGKYGKTEG